MIGAFSLVKGHRVAVGMPSKSASKIAKKVMMTVLRR
jgi:hypothetical protein